MDKLPFSVYDFFGYLAAGFVTLVGLAAAFAGTEDWQNTPGAVIGVLLLVVAYSVGHVIANVAGFALEHRLVGRVLGRPAQHLMASVPAGPVGLFPGYARPLPAAQRERVSKRAQAAGVSATGEGLFLHCFGVVKRDETVLARLDTFLNLYGFARNMSLAALIAGVALIAGSLLGSAKTGELISPGWCAAGCLAGSVGLFYRYLKFFRQYTFEVLISYAEPPETAEASAGV